MIYSIYLCFRNALNIRLVLLFFCLLSCDVNVYAGNTGPEMQGGDYIRLASLYQLKNNDSCFKYAVLQLQTINRNTSPAIVIETYQLLSTCYIERTDFNLALLFSYRALQLCKKAADSVGMARSLYAISKCYRYQGRVRNADNYFGNAFNIAARLPAGKDSIYSVVLLDDLLRKMNKQPYTDSFQWTVNKARIVGSRYPGSPLTLYANATELYMAAKRGIVSGGEDSLNRLVLTALERGWPKVALELYNDARNFTGLIGKDTIASQERIFALAKETGNLETYLTGIRGLYNFYIRQRDKEKIKEFTDAVVKVSTHDRYEPDKNTMDFTEYFNREKALYQLSTSNHLLKEELNEVQMTNAERKWIVNICVVILLLLLVLLISKFRAYQLVKQKSRAWAMQSANTSVAYVELKANDDFKNKLIALIANDFSKPLEQISAITAQLRQYESDPLATTIFIKEISVIARGTLNVFDNILKWVKLQLSGFVYVKRPCKPYEVLQGVLGYTAPLMESKGIVFINQIPQQLVIGADVGMLKMIHQHLLQLAIHFTEPGKLMVISAWEELSLAHIRLITEPSAGVEEVLRSLQDWQQNMYALSLAMTEDFVHKMNGRLTLSTVDQRYLVFHVSFPA